MKILLSIVLLGLCVIDTGSDDIPTSTVSSTFNRNYSITNQTKRPSYCPRQPNHIELVSFWCIIIIIPLTIIGNVLVITVIVSSPMLRRQPMYLFLTSLAAADALVGFITFPMYAKMNWDGSCFNLPFFMCWVFMILEITFSLCSTIHLFVVGLDRYLALRYTFDYAAMMTRKRSVYVLTSVWMVSITWGLMCIFRWKKPHVVSIKSLYTGCIINNTIYFKTTFYVWYITPIFLMAFMYSYIYKTAIHHVNEISKLEVRDSTSLTEKVRRKKQLKLIRSIVIVFTAYTVCWIPLAIFVLILYENPLLVRKNNDWYIIVRFIFTDFLPHFNSTLNPFIYVITNKAFLTAFHTWFTKVTGINLKARKGNIIHSENTKQTDMTVSCELEESNVEHTVDGVILDSQSSIL